MRRRTLLLGVAAAPLVGVAATALPEPIVIQVRTVAPMITGAELMDAFDEWMARSIVAAFSLPIIPDAAEARP
jgi:hypothetical protein